MTTAVARQKDDLAAFELAEHEGVRGITEGRFHTYFLLVGEAGHGVESAAADDADFRLCQGVLLCAMNGLQTLQYKGCGVCPVG